jgi:hypothetical protein
VAQGKKIASSLQRVLRFCSHLAAGMGWLWTMLLCFVALGLVGFWFQKESVPSSNFPSDQITVTVYVSVSPAHVSLALYAYLEPQYDTLSVNVTGPGAGSDPWILAVQCPPGTGLSSQRPVFSEGTSGILQLGDAIVSSHDHKNYSGGLGCFTQPKQPAALVEGQNIDETLPVLEQNPAAQSAQAETPLYLERSRAGRQAIEDLVEVQQPLGVSCQGTGVAPAQSLVLPVPGGAGPGELSPLRDFYSLPSAVTVPCYTPVSANSNGTRYYFPAQVTTSETLENVSLASDSVDSMFPPGQIMSDDKIAWQGIPNSALSPSLSATSLSSARSSSTDTFIAGLLIGGAVGFFVPFFQGLPDAWRSAFRKSGYRRKKRRALHVELVHDRKDGNWHYRVPALHIRGDATTREEALRESRAGIAQALGGDPGDYEPHVVTLEMTIVPAAQDAAAAKLT